jgi:GAF domain-containing protein
MAPPDNQSDVRRDAIKYGYLLNALRRATREIRTLEDDGALTIDDVLEKLLPVIARALDAEKSFVARLTLGYDRDHARPELIGAYPDSQLVGQTLELSDLYEPLLQDGKPLLIDPPGPEAQQPILGLELFQARSAILVRLQTIENTYIVGACNKRNRAAGPFLAADRLALHSILELIGVGARTAERRQRELIDEAVIRIQHTITDLLTKQEQASEIRAVLEPLLDISGFFIATFNEMTNMIELLEVYDHGRRLEPDEKVAGRLHGPRQFGKRQGLIDYVVRTGEVLLVDDMAHWAGRAEIEDAFCQDIRCCLVVPLKHETRIVGVIGLRSYTGPGLFGVSDRELLEKIAPHIAIVIKNAQIYEQRVGELEAISQFQQQISVIEGSEKEVVQRVCEAAHAALQVGGPLMANMFVALYRPENDLLEFPLVYDTGRLMPDAEKTPGSPYCSRHLGERQDVPEWVIRQRQPLLAKTRATVEGWAQGLDGVQTVPARSQSWLGAPMIAGDKVSGMIVLRDFEHENAFTESHEKLLTTIANQAAVAIQNAPSLASARAEAERFSAMYGAGKAIAEAGLEATTVLQAILEQAVKVTGAHFGTFQLIRGENLKFVAAWPPERLATLRQRYPIMPITGPGITALAVRKNHAQLVPDVSQTSSFVDATGGTNSELAVVVWQEDGRPLGVLNVEHPEVGGLNKEDQRTLVALANLAAVAIQNAERAEELSRAKAIALMGAWGAYVVHDINNHVGDIRRSVDILSDRPELAPRCDNVCARSINMQLPCRCRNCPTNPHNRARQSSYQTPRYSMEFSDLKSPNFGDDARNGVLTMSLLAVRCGWQYMICGCATSCAILSTMR